MLWAMAQFGDVTSRRDLGCVACIVSLRDSAQAECKQRRAPVFLSCSFPSPLTTSGVAVIRQRAYVPADNNQAVSCGVPVQYEMAPTCTEGLALFMKLS